MGIDEGIYFAIQTPLNVEVRTAVSYWDYLITIKHPVMRGKEDIVKTVLQAPDEIRRLQDRQGGVLYYKQFDRLYCAVARHMGAEGFLITAYPTDKVKEGDVIWTG